MRKLKPISRVRGGGLVEVLVALAITSMALLTLAASHLSALRLSKLSQYRAVALMLANDYAERMRANTVSLSAVSSYQFTQPYGNQLQPPAAPTVRCNTATGAACSAAQMALEDLYLWRQSARALLPNGAVFSLVDPLAAGAVDVWVAWSDPLVAQPDEIVRTNGARECPSGLDLSEQPAVRCLFMRVQL